MCTDTSLHHPVSDPNAPGSGSGSPTGVELYEADCRLCPAGTEARKECKDGKRSTDGSGSVLERDCSAIRQLTDCATKEDKEQVRFPSSFLRQRHPMLTLPSKHCPLLLAHDSVPIHLPAHSLSWALNAVEQSIFGLHTALIMISSFQCCKCNGGVRDHNPPAQTSCATYESTLA
jgi:hypothetical protein